MDLPFLPSVAFGLAFHLCPCCGSLYVGEDTLHVCEHCSPPQALGTIIRGIPADLGEIRRPQILNGEAGYFRDGRWHPFEMRWLPGYHPEDYTDEGEP